MNQNNHSAYDALLHKLDQFIRKYYLNEFIRGGLYFIGLNLAIYLVISVLEYYLYFSSPVRTVLLAALVGAGGFTLFRWVLLPLMHYFRLGKVLTHQQAAQIIGRHFPEVSDKLLNMLQLRQQAVADSDLVLASIQQRIEQLKPVPFLQAINLSYNRKYLKYALPPLLMIIVLLLAAPSLLRDSTSRLINSRTSFEKPAPFSFRVVDADKLQVAQLSDLRVMVEVTGEALPDQVTLETENYTYRMEKVDANHFTFTFRKVNESFPFYLTANGFRSEDFQVTMLPVPQITGFSALLDYPSYTGKADEERENVGDLIVPAGTRISWTFQSAYTSDLSLRLADTLLAATRQNQDVFKVSHTFLSTGSYTVLTANELLPAGDSIRFSVSVIPDEYPRIAVDEFIDSAATAMRYYAGTMEDDYGLTTLAVRYQLIREDDEDRDPEYKTLPLRTNIRQTNGSFSFPLDLTTFDLQPGDQYSYYFIVWDNDAINGFKSSRTATYRYAMPTREEYREMAQQSSEAMKDDLQETMEEARRINEEIRELQDKLLQKREATWDDKQKMENLLQQQQRLMNQLDRMQQDMQRNMEQQQAFQEQSEQILEKQEKLQELMDELMSDEMKELMSKIKELMEQLNKEEMLEELSEFQMSNEQLEKELDRMMELYKQLELEARMEDMQQQLEELAQQQEELAAESEEEADKQQQGGTPDGEKQQEMAEKQQALNEEFSKMAEELEKMEELSREAGQQMDFEQLQEQQEQTQEQMEQSKQQLQQQQNRNASQQQKKSAQQMQEMAQQMGSMMQSQQSQQMMMDMEATRQLLDNLIKLSFDQEALMKEIEAANVNTPLFKDLTQEQFKIKEDIKMVEDSLLALSKRVVQLSTFVNKEVSEVKYSMEAAITFLADRKKQEATARQQYVMTGLNNLALMLDEALQQMQNAMAQSMAGQQMCQKPNSGQSMESLQKMQQQLNQQMDQLQKSLNEQQSGQPNQPGQQQGRGNRELSRQLAEMAAQQAAIRQALESLQQQSGKNGDSPFGDMAEMVEQMEQTEEDLVNKRLTEEMLRRQQDILVRMLEAAEAEKEREQSPEREAQRGDDVTRKLPPALEEYLRKRESEINLYRTVPPTLNTFYKNIVEDYFKTIEVND